MTHNALRVMRSLRNQVTERHRLTSLQKKKNIIDDLDMISSDELNMFMEAIQIEIVNNQDWKERARTTQLSGDSRGTIFHISRMPDDVVNFVNEAEKLLESIQKWQNGHVVRDHHPRAAIRLGPLQKFWRWIKDSLARFF